MSNEQLKMNTMSEKVKKIMWAVIDFSMTKEQAMATLRIKYAWLYPYITPEVYKEHHDLYLKSKENDVCKCSFPKFHICYGLQVCKHCGNVDHYKNGVVADWSDTDE